MAGIYQINFSDDDIVRYEEYGDMKVFVHTVELEDGSFTTAITADRSEEQAFKLLEDAGYSKIHSTIELTSLLNALGIDVDIRSSND